MRLNFLYLIIILFPLGLFAQGETDWWYFGDHAGMHFTNDTVEPVYNSAMNSFQTGCVSTSDQNGNLLFYGSGNIYNSQHEIMENGELDGAYAISIKSLNDSIYHFIYLKGGEVEGVIPSYAKIDMSENNGLGKVIATETSMDTVLNYITSVRKSNGVDNWVICRKPMGNTYLSYSLTEDGIDFDNPVISQVGDLFMDPFGSTSTVGSLRINPPGNLMAFIHMNNVIDMVQISQGKLELFHFDNETGIVEERIIKIDETNVPVQYEIDTVFGGFNTEFSNDGEKLYFTDGSRVYQSNISILDSTSIIQSLLYYNDFVVDNFLSGLQLAKDGRLYISHGISYLMSVIHKPNLAGLEAEFEFGTLDLEVTNSGFYLPVFDPSLFSSGFTVSNRCLFDETQFELIYDLPYEYVFWEFGDGDTSTEWEPTHVYSETGIYTVQLTTVIDDDTTQKEMEVIIEGYPSVDLGPDSSLFCEGDTLVLDAYNYASYYIWQDSSYQSTFDVTDEGKYYVEVKNICGQDSDTVNFVLDRDNVHLGTDTLICIEEPLLLLADQPTATSWLWQDGSTLPFYEAQQTGEYYVEVTTPCLFIYDSIYVDTKVCSLLAPNIITPNADGINDYFVIENLYEFGYSWSLEIFNRWGQQVYFSENYQNNWKGDELSDGVYFYVLKSQDTDRSYNGSVTVLRE